jgi:hypothetical protein
VNKTIKTGKQRKTIRILYAVVTLVTFEYALFLLGTFYSVYMAGADIREFPGYFLNSYLSKIIIGFTAGTVMIIMTINRFDERQMIGLIRFYLISVILFTGLGYIGFVA